MSLTVAYGALITGVVVWLILVRKLTARAWEAGAVDETEIDPDQQREYTKKVGLWVFLAVITSLFGLFIAAYYMRMGGGHGTLQDWRSLSDPSVLWLNTLVLLVSSLVMQWARSCVRAGNKKQTRDGLLLAGLLTLAFIGGQLYAWRQVAPSVEGWFLRDPAVAFFYLLTAVHGLHLLGGLYVCGRTLLRLQMNRLEAIDARMSVELCTTYWHYLLLVWLVLFGLLLST